jgi:hypothetical protein
VESERENESPALAVELIESGSDIAGAAVGGAVGLIGGPAGVIGGAAGRVVVARTLSRIGAEVFRRIVGPRQIVRMGVALAFAGNEIRERLERGNRERGNGSRLEWLVVFPDQHRRLVGVVISNRDYTKDLAT